MKLISDVGFLGIRNAGVYLFEKPLLHREKDDFVCPEYLYRMAVLKNGEAKTEDQKIQLKELFHFEDISGERFSAVCFPLFSNELLYGVLVCNLGAPLFENGEFLVNQLGSAVKMIDLLKTTERMTRTDPLTGILNRRGFYAEAERRMKQCHEEGRTALLAYVDMNNLKIINDRYGHEEGDFSLKLIGRLLQETVGRKGIAGRIGGDEYACMCSYEEADAGEAFAKKVHQIFEKFNATSDKAYNVTVSVGICIVKKDQEMLLEDALTLADEKLYVSKKQKPKNILKY